MSPTQRTLKKLRSEGWHCDIVERWIPGANIRKDLFGLIDIVAIRGRQTLGVQCTTLSGLGIRVRKFADNPLVGGLRDAGWKLECWGWRRLKAGWEPKVVDVS